VSKCEASYAPYVIPRLAQRAEGSRNSSGARFAKDLTDHAFDDAKAQADRRWQL
jgi:hypothetical protein